LKTYTKNKEDYIVGRLLEEKFKIQSKDVKYLDIGANNYRRGNNTYWFYKKNANGILIEADPILCDNLRKKRKNDKVINVAIGVEDNSSIDFYVLSLPTRSSLDINHVQEALKQGLKITQIIKIPCKTLDTILELNNFEPDYMSIDIEGMDFKVLRTLNLSKHNIKVIVAEICNDVDENGMSMDDYMKSQGYEIYSHCGSNFIYFRKNNDIK
jgi:FkbM family methyltransferase